MCESDTLEEIQYSVGSALTNVAFMGKMPIEFDCNVDNDSDGEPDNRIPIGTPPGVQWDLNTDSGYLRVYGSPIENITEPFDITLQFNLLVTLVTIQRRQVILCTC